MTNLFRHVFGGGPAPPAVRDNETTAISITDWSRQFRPGSQVNFNGQAHQAFQLNSSPGTAHYERNPVVYACERTRISVFSEARFQWQQLRQGRPGDLFGNADLAILEEPWPGATTRDLLAVCELDIATRGNSYWIRDDDQGWLTWLDPLNVKILTEAVVDGVTGARVSERLLGYAYIGDRDRPPAIYEPRDIAHYKPIPSGDRFRGQSWLTACLPDIDADDQITQHKRSQLRTGANLGYVVSLDASITPDQFREFVEMFEENHAGAANAGKTLFLGGGADVKTVGQTFENLALKATQGATETRIAACAGTHPVVVGLSEGMQGSSLNAGNYTAAKRNFVDGTVRPLWGAWCGAFQWLVNVPTSARLWYDDRDIAFLREDVRDQAEILWRAAATIRSLVDAGFLPDSVVDAVKARDVQRLTGNHSGLFSVQLQAPDDGETDETDETDTPTEGGEE